MRGVTLTAGRGGDLDPCLLHLLFLVICSSVSPDFFQQQSRAGSSLISPRRYFCPGASLSIFSMTRGVTVFKTLLTFQHF